MQEIVISGKAINIEDVESMEVVTKLTPEEFGGVQIKFKNGTTIRIYQDEPEQYIEEYFTSKKK